MTALVTVTLTGVEDDAGAVLGNAWLTVRLVSGGAGATVDGNAVGLRPVKIRTDADGDASFTAYPTASTTPTGTYYTVSVDGSSPLIARSFTIPASGPVEWTACPQVEEPVPPLFWPAVSEGAAGDVATIDSSGQLVEWAAPSGGSGGGSPVTIHAAVIVSNVAGTATTVDVLSAAPGQAAAGAIPADWVSAFQVGSLGAFATNYLIGVLGIGATETVNVLIPDGALFGVWSFTPNTILSPWTAVPCTLAVSLSDADPLWMALAAPTRYVLLPTSAEIVYIGGGVLTGALSLSAAMVMVESMLDHDYTFGAVYEEGFDPSTYVAGPVAVQPAGYDGVAVVSGERTYVIGVGGYVTDASTGQWTLAASSDMFRYGNSIDIIHRSTGARWRSVDDDGGKWQRGGADGSYTGATSWRGPYLPGGGSSVTAAAIATAVHGSTSKATPVDADELALVDSAAGNGPKKLTWANLKATIKTYTDTLYDALGAASAAQAYAVQRANHTGTQSADTLTDGTTNKAYTATEKTKLAGIATAATANSSDATLLARANHTGTQAASTVTGLPWPSSHCIEPSSRKPTTFTTWTPTTAAVLGAGYAAGATTASGETWTYAGLPMKAGTWALDLVIRKTSASGIITCALDGSTVGTVDGYNASNLGDQRSTISAAITVAADGLYDLVFTNPTKGTGVAYGWTIQVIDLRRTGA